MSSSISTRMMSDRCIVIEVVGSLDADNADQMVEALSKAYSEDILFAVVDMAATNFIASAGVGSILGHVELFRQRSGDIVLCSVCENIMHVLQVLDLREYLTIQSTAEEALQACKV